MARKALRKWYVLASDETSEYHLDGAYGNLVSFITANETACNYLSNAGVKISIA